MNPTWIDRNRNIIFVILFLVTTGGVGTFYLRQPTVEPIVLVTASPEATNTPTATPLPLPTSTPGQVRVYITGAIVNPDVYILSQGSIIKDAIIAAGGLTTAADEERINQALELQDQQHIHVPRAGEIDGPPAVTGGVSAPKEAQPEDNNSNPPIAVGPQSGLININTATLEQLETLPGIGPVLGQRIIDHREAIGGFKSIEAITEVSGIGEATFAKFQALITINE